MNALQHWYSLNRLTKVLGLALLVLVLAACTTQKKRGQTSKLKKFYHNTTAKYNGYFNANVLLTESIAKLNDQHRDNYNKILEVYPYVASPNASAEASNLDEAIKKVSVVVNLHRDYSHWTDDCYLLLAKAQYVKQNYEDAQEAFEYLAAEFSPEAMEARERAASKKGKKKRKKRRPSTSSSKKRPSTSSSSSGKKKKRPNTSSSSSKKKKKPSTSSSSSSGKKRKRPSTSSSKKKKKPTYNSGKKRKRPEKEKEEETKTEEKKTEEVKTTTPSTSTTTASAPKTDTKAVKENTKSKKEKEEEDNAEKPEGYFLKHKPAFQEGQLWLARTYIERDMFSEAEVILQKLERDPLTFKELHKDLAVAQAYLKLQRKEYDPAIEPLEKAIELATDRSEKARYSYIVAQIHQQEGRGDEALAGFERALKFSPSYEMEFSSRLNVAQNAWLSGKVSSEDATKKLEQMLKDVKNKGYEDQIYFALAQIAIKDNALVQAIKYLKSSLNQKTGNQAQTAESHLLLSELYYGREQYADAKYALDSALMVLPKTDERYKPTEAFRDNLTDIAKNLEIVELQDSLLAIAAMTDQERKELAYNIRKAEEEQRIAEAAKNSAANGASNSRSSNSTFFAYDDKKMKKGAKDFTKRWGDRALEDDWRRSSRRTTGSDIASNDLEQIDKELTQEDIDKIFKDVPRTPEQLKAAKKQITEALFTLGTLYKDRLEKNDLAIETLEDLSNRYPGSDKELEAWYFLYVIFNEEGNTPKAQEYYTKITNSYPKSLYAQSLTDPDFKNQAQAEQDRLNDFYDETYTIFQQAKYTEVQQRIGQATQTFGKTNELQAKFALLGAMSQGNLKGKDEYIKSLRDIIAKFPNTEEQTRAKEILRVLGDQNVAGVRNESTKVGGNFKIDDTQVHYFIIALKNSSIKLSDAKALVSDYNRKFHQLDRLRISNIYLGSDTSLPILVIRRYKDKDTAMRYYNGVLQNEQEFFSSSVDYEMFAVSQSNYRQILKQKSLDNYRSFFKENYLESN